MICWGLSMKKFLYVVAFLAAGCVFLSACNRSNRGENAIILGAIAGPEADLMRTAVNEGNSRLGLEIQLVEFEDYMTPNVALAENSIDANMFQHQPYLDAMSLQSGYHLKAIARTFVFPMGIYSSKHPDKQIPDGATVAIPNDPSNGARALLLLHQNGLIKLADPSNYLATTQDIVENPHQLKIQTLDAAQLPRVLAEVDFAIINTTFAMNADLRPSRDALWIENADSPYANLLVVRTEEANDAKYQKLIEAMHSDAVIRQAKQLFGEEAIQAW